MPKRCRSPHPGSGPRLPHPGGTPAYRDLYEQNPDLIGWLTIDGTDIDLPVVQTPAATSTTTPRHGRFTATGGLLFMDEHCSIDPAAPTANWLISAS